MYFKEKKQTNKQQQKDPLTLKMLSTFSHPIDLEILLTLHTWAAILLKSIEALICVSSTEDK